MFSPHGEDPYFSAKERNKKMMPEIKETKKMPETKETKKMPETKNRR